MRARSWGLIVAQRLTVLSVLAIRALSASSYVLRVLNIIAMPKQPATPGKLHCSGCTKSFTRQSDLSRHVQNVHEGLKPFACPHCRKDFGQKSNLARHLRSCAVARHTYPTREAVPALSHSPSSQSSSSLSSPSPSPLTSASASPNSYNAPVVRQRALASMTPQARAAVNPQALRASLHHKHAATRKPALKDYRVAPAPQSLPPQCTTGTWSDFATANQPVPLEDPLVTVIPPYSQVLDGSYQSYTQFSQPISGSSYSAVDINDSNFVGKRIKQWGDQDYVRRLGQQAPSFDTWSRPV